jgi:penicillin amidase
MALRPRKQLVRYRRQAALGTLLVATLLAVGGGVWIWWVFAGSVPILDGTVRMAGLAMPVDIQRDPAGVATITAANRTDLARALGFLHGQERFFQMDLLRRAGAGELSGLVGAVALPLDRERRIHRFRARAEALLARMKPEHRALIDAYVQGVNAGLTALRHAPYEYTLLRADPAPWRAEDTLLTIYAMYFDLQESDAWLQRRNGLARQVLGTALADFLYPRGTPADAALDGSIVPDPPMPDAAPPASSGTPATLAPPPHGSNAFAVAGSRTATGSAIVANDMHLDLSVPNIWYRAHMRTSGADSVDLDGVTLPGTPFMITGSNGKVAWGFTDAYIATGDAILLDPVPGDANAYLTPDGPKPLTVTTEHICPLRAACVDLTVEETVWGPVVTQDAQGRRVVWRWAAQDGSAIEFDGILALEHAGTVRAALDAIHHAGLPQQNMIVGDHNGHIGWTIAGHVPRRIGLDANVPQSWADGTRGWEAYLPPDQIPEMIDPPDGILWSANNRMVGGAALHLLGDGGYTEAGRARQIRDDLLSKDRQNETALLQIQLDSRAPVLVAWQALLLRLVTAHSGDPTMAAMLPYLRDWGGAAKTGSVGYRLVRSFEEEAIRLIYGGFGGAIKAASGPNAGRLTAPQPAWPSLRLLTQQPPQLVPPPFRQWREIDDALLTKLVARVNTEAGGDLRRFTWGARNHESIHHPLSQAVPLLERLTDPPNLPMDGDALQPHVVVPGFGASERFVVSPGHESDGIFEMPVGEADNPATPYYLAGHSDWVEGQPSPFLPGPPRWKLRLVPN